MYALLDLCVNRELTEHESLKFQQISHEGDLVLKVDIKFQY